MELDRDARRLHILEQYDILDTPPEAAFGDIAQLAAELCEAPIAGINLIGDGRQYFKAAVGFGEEPFLSPFCAAADARFRDTPPVKGTPHPFAVGDLVRRVEWLLQD